jgi:hypothetical protein
VRSLRVTAGRRAALCEERRRIEAGKKILKVRTVAGTPPFSVIPTFMQCCGSLFLFLIWNSQWPR